MLHGLKTFYVIFDKGFVKNRWFALNFYGLHAFHNILLNWVVLQMLVVYAGFVCNKCIVLIRGKEMFSLWLEIRLSFNDVHVLIICYKSYYCINGIWRRCNVRNVMFATLLSTQFLDSENLPEWFFSLKYCLYQTKKGI